MKTEAKNGRICPIEESMKVFAGKWKASILYHIADETCRFNELRRRIPAITQRMLTQQLRELERDGLVKREQFNEIPPRVEYSLTSLGHSLEAIFISIDEWGKKHAIEISESRSKYNLK